MKKGLSLTVKTPKCSVTTRQEIFRVKKTSKEPVHGCMAKEHPRKSKKLKFKHDKIVPGSTNFLIRVFSVVYRIT